jgi:hypothetical protein
MNIDSSIPTDMSSLPNELLIQIASHLDTSPPSVTKFAHEPTPSLTCSSLTPLKTLSLVSWRWRKIVLPILFHCSRIQLDSSPQWVPVDARLIENMQRQLSQLSNHELQIYARMRSKFKSSSEFAFDEAFDELLINLCRIKEGDEFLKTAPSILWFPHLPKTFVDFQQFIEKYSLKHHIKSVVVYTDKDYALRHVDAANAPLSRAVAEIWSQVFLYLNPTRVVVAAPPGTMAGLLDSHMASSDVWAFDMKMHYVEFVQPELPGRIVHSSSACRPWDSALIHRRPWFHLSYNEGSSITAYSTYEYHLKQSPMMLYIILMRLAEEAQDCCNLRSVSFTGVFPFSTNVTTVILALSKLQTLRKVQFQLAPGPENNLLDDAKRIGRAQPRDVWLEWNESIRVITSFLRAFDFANGSEFVSLDCDNSLRADEVQEYIDKLQEQGIAWRKTGEGRWIRDTTQNVEFDEALVVTASLS